MKKFLFAVFGLVALPVIAEVAPVGFWNEWVVTEEVAVEPVQAQPVVPVPPAHAAAQQQRATINRTLPRGQVQPGAATGRNAPGASRAVAARTATRHPAGIQPEETTPSRAAVPARGRIASYNGAAPATDLTD